MRVIPNLNSSGCYGDTKEKATARSIAKKGMAEFGLRFCN